MTLQEANIKIKKLYNLLERTKQQMLGLDWESKLKLKDLEAKIIKEIKTLEEQMRSDLVVK